MEKILEFLIFLFYLPDPVRWTILGATGLVSFTGTIAIINQSNPEAPEVFTIISFLSAIFELVASITGFTTGTTIFLNDLLPLPFSIMALVAAGIVVGTLGFLWDPIDKTRTFGKSSIQGCFLLGLSVFVILQGIVLVGVGFGWAISLK